MRHIVQIFTAVFFMFGMTTLVRAQQEDASAQSAGAASDPTASINFQDLRFRYLDLGGGKARRWYNTEGGYMVTPKLKLINELHYWDTDVSGRTSAWEAEVLPLNYTRKIALPIVYLRF